MIAINGKVSFERKFRRYYAETLDGRRKESSNELSSSSSLEKSSCRERERGGEERENGVYESRGTDPTPRKQGGPSGRVGRLGGWVGRMDRWHMNRNFKGSHIHIGVCQSDILFAIITPRHLAICFGFLVEGKHEDNDGATFFLRGEFKLY